MLYSLTNEVGLILKYCSFSQKIITFVTPNFLTVIIIIQ